MDHFVPSKSKLFSLSSQNQKSCGASAYQAAISAIKTYLWILSILVQLGQA